ncbi:type II toxin-antitoxin system HicA family toxin [Selenomonas sp. AE3005]|uniref:type II toxin-antitoxin system HicA family toxin n=1 Tax=Selenomonas sp. AE3005 TaxID=1485543 RepID=UPI0025CE33DA|nr:type II toxin-antitoxin system HicA family toxin [Selenomonas sp. AE3005]
MSKWEKLLQKIRNNPKTVTFDEIDKVLRSLGYTASQPRGGSSHYTYRKNGRMPLTVPRKAPYVKEAYVKTVMDLWDESQEG